MEKEEEDWHGENLLPQKVKIFARTKHAILILLHATHDVQPPVLVKGNMFKLIEPKLGQAL